jgi:heat shock protein HslJ
LVPVLQSQEEFMTCPGGSEWMLPSRHDDQPEGERYMPVTSYNSVTLDGSYELVHFTVQKSIVPPIAGTRLTAKFEGGQLSGNGGINDYKASYVPSKDGPPPSKASISGLEPTKKGGPQDVMDQEQRFFEGLRAASPITYGDGTIALTWDNAQKSLVFRRL